MSKIIKVADMMKEKPDHARQVLTARPVLAGQRNHPGHLAGVERDVKSIYLSAWCLVLVRSNPVTRLMFHPSYLGTGFTSVACNVCESSISKRKELNEINPFLINRGAI